MLDKRLKLGGMQVGGPRTQQNPVRYRVASNVYQTRDDQYVPRNGCESLYDLGSGSQILGEWTFKGRPFVVALVGGDIKFFYDSTTEIPSTPVSQSTGLNPSFSTINDGIQFSENQGCLFIFFPQFGLYKFDGIQIHRAGATLPFAGCTELVTTGVARIRLIQHHIDFQSNIIHSGYLQFRTTPVTNKIHIRTDKGATDAIPFSDESVGGLPTYRKKYDYPTAALGYDAYFFKYVSAVVDNVLKEVTVQTGGDHSVKVGEYLLTSYMDINIGESVFSFLARGVALKVKSFTATAVVLDMNNAKGLTPDYKWKTENISDHLNFLPLVFTNRPDGQRGGSNSFISVWCSDSSTGVFVYRDLFPAFYDSAASHTAEVNLSASLTATAPFDFSAKLQAFNLVVNLGEIYDVTSSKQVFPFGEDADDPPKSYSLYQSLGLVAYDNEIFFSDTTLGGSFEMTNGIAFAVVGEDKDGGVQSICGNEDFLLVSRKYRNYYVSGSLPTAGYRRQAISGPTLGCYSNEASMALEDKIVFLTKQGVWVLYFGARCEQVSEGIKEVFDTFSVRTNRTEEMYFNLNNLPNFASDEITPRKWIKLRWDSFRGLLIFLKGDGQILVLNMNNGEFYTWTGMTDNEFTLNYRTDDICFIAGFYYLAAFNDTTDTLHLLKELPGDWYYQRTANAVFVSTWMTNGEPSLEKKGCQLKLWGLLVGTFDINYYIDFKETPETETYAYANTNEWLMSHKQQLSPTNFLAWSYEVRLKGEVTKFELEGAEVEYTPQQGGMKR